MLKLGAGIKVAGAARSCKNLLSRILNRSLQGQRESLKGGELQEPAGSREGLENAACKQVSGSRCPCEPEPVFLGDSHSPMPFKLNFQPVNVKHALGKAGADQKTLSK